MLHAQLPLDNLDAPNILCIGAHCDDIEIGCAGTLISLLQSYPKSRITWFVLSGNDERHAESEQSIRLLFDSNANSTLLIESFRDGFLPYEGQRVKERFELLKNELDPDLIFTHYKYDEHQDHRLISELTRNTFRNHLILEYEIPKYDGDIGNPNVYYTISAAVADKKVRTIVDCYQSQSGKHWLSQKTLQSLMRLRGMESGPDAEFAEAFYSRKLLFGD